MKTAILKNIKYIIPFRRQLKKLKPLTTAYEHAAVYINDGSTNTIVGINNFLSWLAPADYSSARLSITFYNESGHKICVHTEKLLNFGSSGVDVSQVFQKRGILSNLGMFTVRLTTKNPLKKSFRELNSITAVFFVFYTDVNGSIAQVHPNARVGDVKPRLGEWNSLQVISTNGLQELVLYQLNGGNYFHELKHFFCDPETDKIVFESTSSLGPYMTKKITFSLDDIKGNKPPVLLLKCDSLPSANAKPILMRRYLNGHYSISHA